MGPNKGETAICDSHYPHDMTVRLREVLARPWIGECVFLVLRWPEPIYKRVGYVCDLRFPE